MKQKIREKLGDIIYQMDGMTLQEAIEFLKNKMEEYKDYENLRLFETTDYRYGNEDKVLEILGTREETDAEYKRRTTAEANEKSVEEARQRAEYERLKKKFEK